MAYEEGLQADPSNDVLKRGLEEVKKAMENDENGPFQGGDMGLGRMFQDPGLIRKLETNPKTREAMLDPGFRAKVQRLQSGGGQMDLQGMMGDPRMLSVLGVAMGIDIVSGLKAARLTSGRDGEARRIKRDAAGNGRFISVRESIVQARAKSRVQERAKTRCGD